MAPLTAATGWFLRRFVAVMLGAVLAMGQDGNVTRGPLPEYQVKAAFLLNFVKFVTWPGAEERQDGSQFDICIVGEDPFEGALDRVVEGEAVSGHPIHVVRVPQWEPQCSVLFIPSSERDSPAILSRVGKGVLTVGESPDFLRNGGMINFFLDDRKVRFDVNRGAADRGSVQISSRLLAVARSVQR